MTMLGFDGVIMGAGTNEYLLPAETSSSQHHMAFAPGRMPSAGDINVGSPIFKSTSWRTKVDTPRPTGVIQLHKWVEKLYRVFQLKLPNNQR